MVSGYPERKGQLDLGGTDTANSCGDQPTQAVVEEIFSPEVVQPRAHSSFDMHSCERAGSANRGCGEIGRVARTFADWDLRVIVTTVTSVHDGG
jgi:hypothetical protein